MSSDDYILNGDPWGNKKVVDVLKAPPPIAQVPLPDPSELLSTISISTDTSKISKIKEKLFNELCHVVSTSNVARLKEILSSFETECLSHLSQVDKELETARFLDKLDSNGSGPLHYAACFGQKEAAFLLLSRGATVDIKDKRKFLNADNKDGWTPLVWATNNGHDTVAKLLVERGAKSDMELADNFGESKITVRDFISRSVPNPSTLDLVGIRPDTRSSSQSPTSAGFYKAGYDIHGMVEEELNQHLFASEKPGAPFFSGFNKFSLNGGDDSDSETIASRDELSPKSPKVKFHWDQCLPDEMFVFDLRQINTIINVLVTNLKMPHMTKSSPVTKLATANSIFLASRYAHYYGGNDLLEEFLNSFIDTTREVLRLKKNDMCAMAYWLANLSQLLYYMKRDPGLLTSTASSQVHFCEFIQDIFSYLIDDGERRLDRLIIPSICDFDAIPGGEKIDYDKNRKIGSSSSKRSSRASSMKDLNSETFEEKPSLLQSVFPNLKKSPRPSNQDISPSSKNEISSSNSNFAKLFSFQNQTKPKPPPETMSPRSITTILSSTLFVLQSYQVHPSFQSQFIRQMFYFISCTVFNAILTHRRYCCRWKGMQIRMNLSVLEDWIRTYSHLKGVKETIRRKIKRKQSNDSQKPSHIVEDLVYPVPVKDLEFYLKWLHPSVVACQLLQIATTSFAEGITNSKGEDSLKAFQDTLDSLVLVSKTEEAKPMTRSSSVLEWNSLNTETLSYSQLHRILVVNYLYEKTESSLSSLVVEFLEDVRLQKLAPGELTPDISRSQSKTSINNIPERRGSKFGSSESLAKSTKSKKGVGQNTLYKDPRYRLVFSLHLLPSIDIKGEHVVSPGEWLDPTEEWNRRETNKDKEKERKDEEAWWETRVKIDIPDWLVKAVE